jgi:hypothetical protein
VKQLATFVLRLQLAQVDAAKQPAQTIFQATSDPCCLPAQARQKLQA